MEALVTGIVIIGFGVMVFDRFVEVMNIAAEAIWSLLDG
jgi:hypothetical protein